MNKRSALAAACAAISFAVPAQAAPILAGSSGVLPTPGVPAGQGSVIASQSMSGTALTFAGIFNQAVYRNTGGTLDFYFQVVRTGPGSTGTDNEIRSFTLNSFDGFFVDGYASSGDPDGGGLFIAANNPNLANGTPSVSTTTFDRSPTGNVLTVEFGANGLSGTENSATYIFRTNAVNFNMLGTFGVIDGSSWQGMTYQPIGPGVPEPATWAMMIVGVGLAGGAVRRARHRAAPATI